MAGTRRRVSESELREALSRNAGILLHTAADLGIDRKTVERRVKKNLRLQKFLEQIESSNLDRSEGQLHRLINEGHPTAIIFYLKTKGKHRGYGQSLEVEATVSVGDLGARLREELDQRQTLKVIEGGKT